jgi:hypothetical protein
MCNESRTWQNSTEPQPDSFAMASGYPHIYPRLGSISTMGFSGVETKGIGIETLDSKAGVVYTYTLL